MADIICRLCGEPTDAYHFRHDADYDVDEGTLARLAERLGMTLPENYPWKPGTDYEPQTSIGVSYKAVVAGLGCDSCSPPFAGLDATPEPNEQRDLAFLASVEDSTDGDEILVAINSIL